MGTSHEARSVVLRELFLEPDPRIYCPGSSSESVGSLTHLQTSFLHTSAREDSIDFNLVA